MRKKRKNRETFMPGSIEDDPVDMLFTTGDGAGSCLIGPSATAAVVDRGRRTLMAVYGTDGQ